MTVRIEEHRDVSAPLRDMIAAAPQQTPVLHEAEPVRRIPLPPGLAPLPEDPVRQRTGASVAAFAPVSSLSFEGLGQGQYGFTVISAPPDTEGTVGATQYVQWVNTSFAVFNKANGTLVAGPTTGNALWSGFGGGCETNNDGDPIVLYDKAAQRWVFSQFSVSTTPFLQCIAVSTTSDATGTYNRYSFQYTDFDDYPKMSVWSDAYYETFNMFGGTGNNTFVGADACAYDRAAMLGGTAAMQICFQQNTSVGGLLPSDIDGATAPPAGSPNYMIFFGTNNLNLFKFHVDFTTPTNSTFTGPTVIAVAAFSPLCGSGGTCVPQPGTTQQLDSLADRLMYRLAYRNFGTHESLVVNHSVVAGSSGGVRWYEIQNPSGTPTVAQQSTFAPDSSYRWMGSIAMDKVGDMALGYSVSDATSVFPSIAFTGRVATDPASTMETEVAVVSGSGSQVGNDSKGNPLTRWGDYSAMQIDPVDDCTFWYTQEYITTNGVFNWNTHIASFSFPSCTGATTFPLTVTLAGTGSGTVSSTPPSVSCPGTCSASFASGTSVTLSASPAAGSTFAGWSGACTGTGSCTVTMSAAQSVTATFVVNFPLSVTVAGSGSGTVTSTPMGISCPGACSASFASGTSVTLTETPAAGSTFAGWSGACTGTGSCTVTMSSAQSVTATLNATVSFSLSVTLAGTGSGTVTSSPTGVSCPGTCSASFASGTSVTLSASAAAGSTFAGWSGTCTGTGSCTVTMSAAQSVTATFVVNFPLSVTITGSGSGTVTSAPMGISCPSTCSASFARGTSVTLSASAAAGSIFIGWSGGGCTGTGNCTLTVSMAQSVTGTFNLKTTTTTTLTVPSQANAGTSVTFAAKVTPASGGTMATGTVTLTSGSTVLGPITLSGGSATFSTSSLATGSYSFTAAYSGDTNFAGSSSAPAALMVVDFTFTPPQSSLTATRGLSAQTSLTVTPVPLAGFSPTVTFACSGLPSESTCTFNPPSVSPNGAAASTMVTIKAVAPTAALERGFGRTGLFYALFLPGLMGFVFLNRSKKKRLAGSVRVVGVVGILALSTVWWTACGSNSHTPSNPGTPVGSSTVTVTATSSGNSPITKQVTIALTVQ